MAWLQRATGRAMVEADVNGAFWVFAALLAVQFVHMFEHAAQVHQFFLGIEPARGFFGAWFDFVWVHFAFNIGVFAVIFLTYFLWRRQSGGWQVSARGRRWFLILLWFQGYHAGEHVLQMAQHLQTGTATPPGLIGRLMPNPIAHFDLNLILMVLLAGVAINLRPRRVPVLVQQPVTA